MTIEAKLILIVILFVAGVATFWWNVTHEKSSPDMDMTWYAISQRKQSILWKIHNASRLPDGEDSPEVEQLWSEYDELEELERSVTNENY